MKRAPKKRKGYVYGTEREGVTRDESKITDTQRTEPAETTKLDDKGNPTKTKSIGNFGSKLGASMGWLQYANQAQTVARATEKKDTIVDPITGKEVTGYKDEQSMLTETGAKPTHEVALDAAKEGKYGQAILATNPLFSQVYQYSKLRKGNEAYNQGLENIESEKQKAAANEAKDLALAARERGETGYSTLSDYRRDPSVDEKKVTTKENIFTRFGDNLRFAKGGEIVGKGTGTSDSINAEVEEGSFVVPAKHAHVGKMIKEALGKKKHEKATLHQKDGVPVKLSNGEILFTPEEKEEIESEMGEETLEALAPEAEENEEGKAKGGELSAAKALKILHDKEVNGKPLTDKQRRYMGWVAGGSKMATGGEVDDDYAKKELAKLEAEKKNAAKVASDKELMNKKISSQKEEERKIAKNIEQKKKYQKAFADDFKAKESKYKALKDSYETFLKQSESALKQPKQYGLPKLVNEEGERKKKENLLKLLNEAESDYNKSKKIYEGSKNDANWNSDGTVKSGNLPKASSLSNIGKKATDSIKTPATSNVFSTPSVKSEAQLSGNKPKVDANKIWANSLNFTPPIIKEGEGDNIQVPLEKTEVIDADKEIANPNTNSIDTNPVSTTSVGAKTGFWDKVKGIGNVDLGGVLTSGINYGLGAYQIKEGRKGLQGERPINKIDPTFQANVDTAQANAKFGFTPEQQFKLDQDKQNLFNQEMFAAKNYAGGSGGNAFNMSRNAANNAFTRSLQNVAANTELQQGKQQFAAQLAAQKAQMSRNIFEDSLRAFEQKQQSAGNLMATGISNILDTNRFANFMRLRGQENQFNNEYGV